MPTPRNLGNRQITLAVVVTIAPADKGVCQFIAQLPEVFVNSAVGRPADHRHRRAALFGNGEAGQLPLILIGMEDGWFVTAVGGVVTEGLAFPRRIDATVAD